MLANGSLPTANLQGQRPSLDIGSSAPGGTEDRYISPEENALQTCNRSGSVSGPIPDGRLVRSRGSFLGLVSNRFRLHPAPSDVLRIFDRAGLLDNLGRIKNGNISQYLNLFKLASAREGGLLSLVRAKGLVFVSDNIYPEHLRYLLDEKYLKDFWPLAHITHPNAFIRDRNNAALSGGEDLGSLVGIYRHYISAALMALRKISDFNDKHIGKFSDMITGHAIALLFVMFETLLNESPDIIRELPHHIDMSGLLIIQDALIRTLGADLSEWDKSIAAHIKRDEGCQLHYRGILTWNGKLERPDLKLPEGIWENLRLFWKDHPLFKEPDLSAPCKLGGADKLGKGFERVEIPNGPNIYWRYQRNSATLKPEVLITGDLPALAEMAQRLSAANGGLIAGFLEDSLFPLNNAIESITMLALYKHDPDEEAVYNCTPFSDQTALNVRFNSTTMMYEIIFSNHKNPVLMNEPTSSPLSPNQLLSVWKKVLADYISDSNHEHEIMLPSPPDLPSIFGIMKDVMRMTSVEAALQMPANLDAIKGLVIRDNLQIPKGTWQAMVGVRTDRTGRIKRLLVQFYQPFLRGRWGDTYLLKLASPVEVLEAGPSNGNWNKLEIKRQVFAPADRTLLDRFRGDAISGKPNREQALAAKPMPRPIGLLPRYVDWNKIDPRISYSPPPDIVNESQRMTDGRRAAGYLSSPKTKITKAILKKVIRKMENREINVHSPAHEEDFRLLLDRIRLIKKARLAQDVKVVIEDELSSHFLALMSETSLVTDYARPIDPIVTDLSTSETFTAAHKHYLKNAGATNNIGIVDTAWGFIRFLEIHVGIELRQNSEGKWYITEDSIKKASLRHKLLSSAKRARILGKEREKIWKLIDEVINYLA